MVYVFCPYAPKSIVFAPYAAGPYFSFVFVRFVTVIRKSLGHAVGRSPCVSTLMFLLLLCLGCFWV